MDGQKSQAKLTRTGSSLLRSSPTIRSSIHSLNSVTEEDVIAANQAHHHYDEEDPKPKNYNHYHNHHHQAGPGHKPGPTRFSQQQHHHHHLSMASVAAFSVFTFSAILVFLHLRRDEIPTSENLLVALVFIAVALFLANKNKGLINHSVSALKHSWDENLHRFRFHKKTNGSAKPVHWMIGPDPKPKPTRNDTTATNNNKIIREGVEFYSNGDFYEGEFHKGKCNGSGVYNYFVNGRYEGDWIDGRYDGYGIEGWARGSRYKGQYRQGSRHGYGVYRFYTGDSYSGEWCNGQSHGVGVQTCSDGSCYVGEFKYGAKHGLGCYHFRLVV